MKKRGNQFPESPRQAGATAQKMSVAGLSRGSSKGTSLERKGSCPVKSNLGGHGERKERVLAVGHRNALSGCLSPRLLKV